VSYDRTVVAAEEDRRARAVLGEMQMRISQGPYAALSIAENATAEEVRASFLQLTKQFHPARFGRLAPEIQKLSNEVFLGIKNAHDMLARQLGARRGLPHTSTGTVTTEITRPSTNPLTAGTQRGTGLVSRTTTPTLARGTDRASTRPSSPVITQSTARVITAAPTQSRAPTPSSPTPAATQPMPHAVRVATPPLGVQTRAPTGPLPRTTTPVDLTGRTPTPRPSTLPPQRAMTPPARPGTPQPDAITPPTIRYSGVQPTQALPRVGGQGAPFDEQTELRAAMDLLSSKNYPAARQAFHALAAKMPQSRQYRALLCYARGRETAASGRIDDAVLEFQRALQLDSELEIAKQAIRELGRKTR
jgi:hypothetical protein